MDKEREMFALIEAWEKSGQKQPDFCAVHGINLSRFGYWRTKWLALHPPSEKETPPAPSFIPIKKATTQKTEPQPEAEKPADGCELIYPNGVRLRLPSLDLSILKQLIDYHV